jgi:uncharacterized membrane protein
MLKIRKIGFWEYLVYTIGLSIAFLMFGGLAVNWILPWLRITDNPLSLTPLTISFATIISIFVLIAYRFNKNISLKIRLPKVNRVNKTFFAVPIIFPILSILGAITLNNGGHNYLTMIMLSGIAIYVLIAVLLKDKINENIYPWSIFMISISLLLATSMRGWILSGHDVISEYHVFQLTKSHFRWSISYLKDPYNACLSITLLPTIFYTYIHVNDYLIYKFFFQIISGIISINIFLFIRRFTTNINAYLASFFFASQFVFFVDFPFLIRQEIATVFFTLSFVGLFDNNILRIKHKLLFILFAFSMIVSHYSTTYLALGLMLMTYLIYILLRRFRRAEGLEKNINFALKEVSKDKHNLSLIIIFSIFLFAFVWYSQVTKTSNNIEDFVSKTYQNMGQLFNQDFHTSNTSFADQFNLFYKPNVQEQFNKYVAKVKEIYSEDPHILQYSESISNKYPVHILNLENPPFHIPIQVINWFYFVIGVDGKIIKLFTFIGIISFIIFIKKLLILNIYL